MNTEEKGPAFRYVVYMEDGNGQEFFLNEEQVMLPIADGPAANPLLIKNIFQVYEQLRVHRALYPHVCRFFALEQNEFEHRRSQLKQTPTSDE